MFVHRIIASSPLIRRSGVKVDPAALDLGNEQNVRGLYTRVGEVCKDNSVHVRTPAKCVLVCASRAFVLDTERLREA